jgi:hypothetical protein
VVLVGDLEGGEGGAGQHAQHHHLHAHPPPIVISVHGQFVKIM